MRGPHLHRPQRFQARDRQSGVGRDEPHHDPDGSPAGELGVAANLRDHRCVARQLARRDTTHIARVERIEAQLSILALLRREVEVVKLTLTGPNILFEQVGGKPNWIANAPDLAPNTPPKTMLASGFAPTFTLRIRTVEIRNGMVTWQFPQRTKIVGIRSLELQHPVDGGPLDLAATLVYSDYQPFSLRASAQPTGAFNDPWRTRIDVAAFDTTASAAGTVDVGGSFDLQIEAKAGALENLNALLPEMRLPALHQAVLSSTF